MTNFAGMGHNHQGFVWADFIIYTTTVQCCACHLACFVMLPTPQASLRCAVQSVTKVTVDAAARPASSRKAGGQKAARTRKANTAAGKPKGKPQKAEPETKGGDPESKAASKPGPMRKKKSDKTVAKKKSPRKTAAKPSGKGRGKGKSTRSPAKGKTAAKSQTGVTKGGIAKHTRSSRTKG